MFEFEWDPAKAASNFRKHAVSFELAATVLQDPLSRSVLDEEHGGLERRWTTVGLASDGQLLVVSHADAETVGDAIVVRLISARPATCNERREYESGE